MTLANFRDLVGCVTIACGDLSQVFTRHAVEAVNPVGMLACRHEKFVECRPIVPPVEIEAYAAAQFCLTDLAKPPFVEDVLITGKDSLYSEDNGAISELRPLLEQSRCKALGRGQGVIITDEYDIGLCNPRSDLLGIYDRIIGVEGMTKIAQVFSTVLRIVSPNFAFHCDQRLELGFTAA